MCDFRDAVLFSTNSELAYKIAKKYYKDKYFAWCSTSFDLGDSQPASSNPRAICNSYLKDIATKDNHSMIIEKNRVSILRGAAIMLKRGVITIDEELQIRTIVDAAKIHDFFPLVYIINGSLACSMCKEATVDNKAAPHSIEYIAEDLTSEMFSVIRFKDTLSGIKLFEEIF
jgi:hypothetical protein